MGVELPLPRMAVALGVAPRQQRVEELAAGRTLQEHWDGTAGPSQEGQSSQAVGSQGSWSQDRRGRSKAKPSAIRQDKELEADYQRVAAKRAEQRPDAPRLSRSSYMRNRSRPPKAVRAAKGGGKDRAGNQPESQDGAPPGVRPPPPKPDRQKPAAAAAAAAPGDESSSSSRSSSSESEDDTGQGSTPLIFRRARR